MDTATQRLDKWLWFSRLIKTRSLANKLVSAGKVRVNRVKVTKPSANVREGDVLTAVIHERLRVIKILAPGDRRGPAVEAQALYEDLSPVEEEHKPVALKSDKKDKARDKPMPIVPAAAPSREKGAGRPTKRDRRKMVEFHEASSE